MKTFLVKMKYGGLSKEKRDKRFFVACKNIIDLYWQVAIYENPFDTTYTEIKVANLSMVLNPTFEDDEDGIEVVVEKELLNGIESFIARESSLAWESFNMSHKYYQETRSKYVR